MKSVRRSVAKLLSSNWKFNLPMWHCAMFFFPTLLTAHGNIPDGLQAIKDGAFDYITKGDDNNKIIPLISRAVEKAKKVSVTDRLRRRTVGCLRSSTGDSGQSFSMFG